MEELFVLAAGSLLIKTVMGASVRTPVVIPGNMLPASLPMVAHRDIPPATVVTAATTPSAAPPVNTTAAAIAAPIRRPATRPASAKLCSISWVR
jgi:hypothetical protein